MDIISNNIRYTEASVSNMGGKLAENGGFELTMVIKGNRNGIQKEIKQCVNRSWSKSNTILINFKHAERVDKLLEISLWQLENAYMLGGKMQYPSHDTWITWNKKEYQLFDVCVMENVVFFIYFSEETKEYVVTMPYVKPKEMVLFGFISKGDYQKDFYNFLQERYVENKELCKA
jgi:hypothetical protein